MVRARKQNFNHQTAGNLPNVPFASCLLPIVHYDLTMSGVIKHLILSPYIITFPFVKINIIFDTFFQKHDILNPLLLHFPTFFKRHPLIPNTKCERSEPIAKSITCKLLAKATRQNDKKTSLLKAGLCKLSSCLGARCMLLHSLPRGWKSACRMDNPSPRRKTHFICFTIGSL